MYVRVPSAFWVGKGIDSFSLVQAENDHPAAIGQPGLCAFPSVQLPTS